MTGGAKHIGDRRLSAWWEPTFAPALHDKLSTHNWDFSNSVGCKGAFLSAAALKLVSKVGEVQIFENLTFEDCDIQGVFEHKPAISFRNCRFHGCDFSFSEWVRTSFRDCEFRECSFALTTFDECEFRECEWEKIGMQGSKTDFIRTFITNPRKFMRAGFSGTREDLKHDKKHVAYQAYRLEQTKAHVSRNILFSHRDVSDNATYYESARAHDFQQVREKIWRDFYSGRFGKGWEKSRIAMNAAHILELIILWVMGVSNKWGESIVRPIICLLISFLIFSMAYKYLDFLCVSSGFLQKSFDISIIAGYGNQYQDGQNVYLRVAQGIQLTISILFYSVFFSTIVSRNSRSR